MAASKRSDSSSAEPLNPSGILTLVAGVNLEVPADAIAYVQSAYDQIIQKGYQMGSGDRELIKNMIALEEKNGLKLTRKIIAKLDTVLDLFESYENTLSATEHENRYYLVGIYNAVAGSVLDVNEEQAELDKTFQSTLALCQLFSEKNNLNLEFFAHSIIRYASDIHLSKNSTVQERTSELLDLANGMGLLKLLIDRILNVESEYAKKKWSSPKATKTDALRKFEEAVQICALEAVKGNPEPERWFHYLWTHAQGYAEKFADAKIARESGLFSPKLAKILQQTILENKVLREYAQHSEKFASQESRAALEERVAAIMPAAAAASAKK
jgi:hypothetical protein